MKICLLITTPVVFWFSLLMSGALAAPHNQYQDPIKERRVAAYTWLYGEAVAGNETAGRNLKLLERIYGPALTDLSKRVATEWEAQLIDRFLSLKYDPEDVSPEFVIAETDIEKVMAKWGYYPSRNVIRVLVERWIERDRIVSLTTEYSRTSFGLMERPAAHLVSAWSLGYGETADPLVVGTGTSARIARRYP